MSIKIILNQLKLLHSMLFFQNKFTQHLFPKQVFHTYYHLVLQIFFLETKKQECHHCKCQAKVHTLSICWFPMAFLKKNTVSSFLVGQVCLSKKIFVKIKFYLITND